MRPVNLVRARAWPTYLSQRRSTMKPTYYPCRPSSAGAVVPPCASSRLRCVSSRSEHRHDWLPAVLPSHTCIGFRVTGAESGLFLADALSPEFTTSGNCARAPITTGVSLFYSTSTRRRHCVVRRRHVEGRRRTNLNRSSRWKIRCCGLLRSRIAIAAAKRRT